MMENQNTFDMTENIPDEKFQIIGLEKRCRGPGSSENWILGGCMEKI